MHELSIAAAVAESAQDAARRHGAASVESVRVRVGELSGVVPDALRFSFEVVTEGTALAGAALVVEEVPARARCGDCAGQFAPGTPPRLWCPGCRGAAVELVAGRELEIADVTLPGGDGCPGDRPERRDARQRESA
ncbi:hydrogenase maturation nickel metallochaperone HypA [Streptomyces sp. TRM 70361]|uniref:hydrogenase maturation nickel metallochaperone HypA n=1 Tax=Streptomyces sp. TRM 70361 TaxID=3116553 RepID=UPI002E7C563C|nr:hydrogenase maturation nickel metallochaperone HypA [Streptomyces sp. TRM 70361]MEE1940197.1 hydrogenase maturation nickel metallochaperone HypA [Streptomyces sp. TRM 70361]